MGLTRTLRKHMKKLLAVFGALLMIAFLLPTSLQRIGSGDPGKQAVARIFDGQEILVRDWNITRNQTEILNALVGFLANQPSAQILNWRSLMRFSEEPLLDYMLLIREAQHMGIKVSRQQVDQLLADCSVPPELVNRLMRQMNVSLDMVYTAVGNLMKVQQGFALALQTVKVSQPQLRHFFALTQNQMTTSILPLYAEQFSQAIPVPNQQQLTEHFDQNRQTYRYPDQVVVEYISADFAKIALQMKVTSNTAKRYWQENRSKFTTTAPASSTDVDTAVTTAPAVARQMTFEEAHPIVDAKIKARKARSLAAQALTAMRRQSAALWSDTELDEFGVKIRPDNISDYRQLAQEFSRKFEIPIDYNRSDPVDKVAASQLPGIGRAFIMEREQVPLEFSQYAFRVVPLVPPPDNSSNSRDALILTKDQDCAGLLRTVVFSGQSQEVTGFYIFRVVQVIPTHLPESLDEVHQKVQQDWQLDQGYKIALDIGGQLLPVAAQVGLANVLDSDNQVITRLKELVKPGQLPEVQETQFSRRIYWRDGNLYGPFIESVRGSTAEFADACFQQLWSVPESLPAAGKNCIMISDNVTRCYYLVELVDRKPITEQDYRQMRANQVGAVLMPAQQQFYRLWFDSVQIRRRTNYSRQMGWYNFCNPENIEARNFLTLGQAHCSSQ